MDSNHRPNPDTGLALTAELPALLYQIYNDLNVCIVICQTYLTWIGITCIFN